MEDINRLNTVHDAVQRCQIRTNVGHPPLVVGSFRVDEIIKDQAEKILAQHGVTLSSYVAECLECLVDDYVSKRTRRKKAK